MRTQSFHVGEFVQFKSAGQTGAVWRVTRRNTDGSLELKYRDWEYGNGYQDVKPRERSTTVTDLKLLRRATPEQVAGEHLVNGDITGASLRWDPANTSIPASYDREPEGRY